MNQHPLSVIIRSISVVRVLLLLITCYE